MKRKFKKKKLNSGIKKGLMLLIPLTTISLISSCGIKNETKYTKIECTSDGEYTETLIFIPEGKEYRAFNEFTFYGGWHKDGDRYSCDVVEYSARDITYEVIKPILNNEKEPNEVLGEPLEFRTETKASISKELLDKGPYYSAIIYNKGEEAEYSGDESNSESKTGYAVLIGSGIAFVAASGALAGWKYYDAKQEEKKKLTLKNKKRD